jgi:hypothetical protein
MRTQHRTDNDLPSTPKSEIRSRFAPGLTQADALTQRLGAREVSGERPVPVHVA